ncbi:fungal-specific transcription factor domain-domain-containing protein [Kockovaella imperatae]|uniref:Fungal-specific transcription factor domain-domain-containing protein n=1 Tax=Kockovaella imperatae TaxID=4999 RepID=A0A1Y1UJD5_9TREE|nr:fungal-specific transcription factor domain-domain-containing protein [Kockovaella imperatae]ORX37235.1 fungal-specific transcription factor domain-domain-containing protein [Kockovaella imperatae]
MKIPSDRRTSDTHYSPYPSSSSHSDHQFHPPPVPPNRKSNGTANGSSSGGRKSGTSSPSKARSSEDPGTQYKVARAISSCTRCRSRKQKCDGKLPACTACERANVECIGFDAISKTNISRNYLHSLEQEVASLRAQVAALTDERHDTIGQVKRGIAANASQAISTFAPPILHIDPTASSHSDMSEPLRSPWDSPGFAGGRRHSEYGPPPPGRSVGGNSGGDSPRSPFFNNRLPPMMQSSATSLTRMVHDAAYRTGHALNSVNALQGTSVAGSEKSIDSPAANHDMEGPSPGGIKRHPSASPMATSSSIPGSGKMAKKRAFAIPPLPPQPAVERLVAAYVDFVGVTAPIIHIPTLGKQIIRMREGRDVEESDVFVVMMVLALSTMASSRFVEPPDELRACSEAFHAEAMKHLDAVFEEQTYVGLQAILLLVWYSLLNPDKGSIWFLVGLACRTCVDLGFHNERNAQKEQLDNLEVDMRRRLFWCVYKMDRLLSTSLGRPVTIPDGFINVEYPSALHDVDIHAGSYDAPPADIDTCAYKTVFLHTCRLRQMQSRILYHTYGIYLHEAKRAGPSQEWFDDMFDRLKQWLATTPEPRGAVSSEGFAISFHNSVLLLFRPSPGNPRPGKKALQTVLASSSYIIRIYRRMQLNNRISWLWMTSHYSFMAGISFLYAFFNLYSMGDGEGVPTLDEAQLDLESCQAVLAYLAPRVPSAGACHDTMQTLSKAILDQLAASDPPQNTAPSPGRIRSSAPVSSSRHDPHPSDRFPAPLPQVQLPYELSLLDNVFINPMAAHNKASDYTNGKARCKKMKEQKRLAEEALHHESSKYNLSAPNFENPPQGFPPGAFGGNIDASAASAAVGGGGGGGGGGGNGQMLHHYAMAAQVNSSSNPSSFILPQTSPANPIPGFKMEPGIAMATGGLGPFTMPRNDEMDGPSLGGEVNNFDILNFLMDEEGGLGGTTTWDASDIPADFSLWT